MSESPRMTWTIRTDKTDGGFETLEHDQIVQRLSTGRLGLEDWGLAHDDDRWRQLGEFAEFETFHATRRRRSAGDEDDAAMDMTPMIDVTFLLLVFFMITATFHLQKGLDFPPPESQEERGAQQPAPGLSRFADRILVTIDETDTFALKSTAAGAGEDPIDPAELTRVLTDVSRDQKKNRLLVLAHDLSSNEAVVKIIDAAAQAGIRDVALADIAGPGSRAGGGSNATKSPMP